MLVYTRQRGCTHSRSIKSLALAFSLTVSNLFFFSFAESKTFFLEGFREIFLSLWVPQPGIGHEQSHKRVTS